MLKIQNLIIPPIKPVENTGSWMDTEQSLKTNLPSDFKELISVYGTGCFSDFIWILNPFSRNKNINLGIQSDIRIKSQLDFEADTQRVLFNEKCYHAVLQITVT